MKNILKTIFIFLAFVFSLVMISPQEKVFDTNDYIQNSSSKIFMVAEVSNAELASYIDRFNNNPNFERASSSNPNFTKNDLRIKQQVYTPNFHNLSNLLENKISIRAP